MANKNETDSVMEEDKTFEEGEEDAPLVIAKDKVEKLDKPTNEVKSPFMPSGDSLRGIGVTLVILYHMGYEQFKNAWFVISLFFSLSGFIMTKNTVEQFERRGEVDVLKFWAKRISRLFPALLLTLIIILLSQKTPFRREDNDGNTFQREVTDIWYATLFLTNYNIAYNQVDDYFQEFSTPSVTRHLWTLSIEEQYYIVWPILLFVITKVCVLVSKKRDPNYKLIDEVENNRDRYTVSGTSKLCVQAILVLDIVVMATSYISATITVRDYGMTQAYYSTMCRMGDIAAGGFTYSFVRLNPYLSRRWFRDPSLPPMSFMMRVILELLGLILIILLVTVPMIQTPEDDMLEIYFKWFRLLISLMLSGVVANTIQLSEPLPRWALVSKFVTFKPMIIVGVISYGVYVFHWPLLVYFGDAKAINKKKAERGWAEPYEGFLGYEGRNVVLFILVMIIGYFSFFYFELPCLTLSRATAPKKTISAGFLSIGVTLLVHWFVAKDLPPIMLFENDAEALDDNIDHRFTPIQLATPLTNTQDNMLEMLDFHTRASFIDNNKMKSGQVTWWDQIVNDVTGEEFASSDAFFIVACKNVLLENPCNHPEMWEIDTYWFWLDSKAVCGKDPPKGDFNERCDDLLSISEISDEMLSEKIKSDGGPRLANLIVSLDDAYPGIMNQNTVTRLHSMIERGDTDLFGLTNSDAGEDWDPIQILFLGDSVGQRLGMFLRDSIELDLTNMEDVNFPSLDLTNLAAGGFPCVSYFACLSNHPNYKYDECHQFKKNHPSNVLNGFDSVKPNVVIVHDGHIVPDDGRGDKGPDYMVLLTNYEKIMAFSLMLGEAKKAGVEQMIMLTMSNVGKANDKMYYMEMDYYLQMADVLGCPEDDPSGMWVSIMDWEKLICPNVADGSVCEQNVHGFEELMPDDIHPAGEPGLWLSRQSFSVMIAQIARYSLPERFGKYLNWDEAIDNPISKRLLQLSPPDGEPTLRDLASNFYMCPSKDLVALEKDLKSLQFSRYDEYQDHERNDDFEDRSDILILDPALAITDEDEYQWYSESKQISERYDHRAVLSGADKTVPGNNAVLDWAVNQTHIRMAVAAPATGYLGFGLADSGGGFAGADMVFFEAGNPNSLRDTYTIEEGKLLTDECAGDWELVDARIINDYMVFETVRLLDTGDARDRKIIDDSESMVPPHRILAAWGDSQTAELIEQNSHKGTLRFNQGYMEPFASIMERGAEGSATIQALNYEVPAATTDYYFHCLTKNDMIAKGLPNSYEKLHIIGFEPMIQTANKNIVHHFLVFGHYDEKCATPNKELLYFWGDGLGDRAMPEFAGLPFYEEGTFNSFQLHIHYNNPLERSDIIDSSGFRIYWTGNLREQDIGTLVFGDPWVKKQFTQLGRGLSKHDFDCPSSCTSNTMDQPITVFQETHHTHKHGVQTSLTHYRNGEEIRSGKVEYFDWNVSGSVNVVQESFTIQPGDSFIMSCYYNDPNGANAIFGTGSEDEMCLGSYMYYPKVNKDVWMCGYDLRDKECSTPYKHKKIPNVEALDRIFPYEGGREECPI